MNEDAQRGRPIVWGPDKRRYLLVIRCSSDEFAELKEVLPKNAYTRYEAIKDLFMADDTSMINEAHEA